MSRRAAPWPRVERELARVGCDDDIAASTDRMPSTDHVITSSRYHGLIHKADLVCASPVVAFGLVTSMYSIKKGT